jgi:hypothetical protein
MDALAVVALLGLCALVITAAAYRSIYRMWEEYLVSRRRLALRVAATPVLFVLLAVLMRLGGEGFAGAAFLFMFMGWLALVFWDEL